MSSSFDDLAERARKIAAESGESVREKIQNFQDSPEWEQTKKMAGELGEDAAAFVRKYPIQSVLGAAAVGFLLGASLGRKR